MGAVECCQGPDRQLKVSIQQKNMFMIENPQQIASSMSQFQMTKPKIKIYGDIFFKKNEPKSQFILQIFSSGRGSEVANVPMKIYSDSLSHSQQKQTLKLEHPINDPNQMLQTSQILFLSKQRNTLKTIYKILPFNRYEEQKFKAFIYEIYMNRKVSSLKCLNIVSTVDEYIIQSGIDKEANDKCCISISESCLATLHEIVNYRKDTNEQWTEGQFQTLMNQMIRALNVLHNNKIAHRNIRHHNIFYSQAKKAYLLGGFRNSKVLTGKPNQTHSIIGVPYFANQQLKKLMKQDQFSTFSNYNCYNSDIYALGVTLASSFFLQPCLPTSLILPSLLKYQVKYPFLKTLIAMVKQNPPSASSLCQYLNQAGQKSLRQQNLIQSLRYKSKPQDEEFVAQRKAIANGYYHMFMYDNWAIQINQVVNYYELKHDRVQLAETYKLMGDIYTQHHQQQSIRQYYERASKLFSQIGDDSIKQKRVEEGIRYLEKGIQCNRRSYGGAENYDIALLLNRLAMAHHLKSQYQIARAFQEEAMQITGKVKSQNSLQFAKMIVDGAKIQSEFQQFKQAQNMLKAGLKILETKNQDYQTLKIKARILQALGNNYRMKAIQRRDKADQNRQKAQQCILDALEISEKLQGTGDIQIANILESLGNVYFDKRDFHKAKKTYQRSLIIKKHILPDTALQIGESLTELANCYKSLRQYQNAIKYYDEAVQVFRKSYGNDHNANTAVAIGNIGIVYKQLGKMKEARDYLTLGKNILKDLYGEASPDYQYFDRQI